MVAVRPIRERVVRHLWVAAVCCAVISLLGCSEGLKRPPGYLRIGHVSGLVGKARNLEEFDLIVRRDEGGLSAMSTQCTYDLSPLLLRRVDGKLVLVSQYSSSTYDIDGRVLSGPARVDLPYYELRFEAELYGGPRNTIYVQLGREVGPSWRLPVTAEMEQAAQTPPTPRPNPR